MKKINQKIEGAACAKNQPSGMPAVAQTRSCQEYLNRFWEEIDHKQLCSSAVNLYMLLLKEATRNKYAMPIKFPTRTLANKLSLSNTSVIRARQILSDRGLISFTNGVRNIESASYTLLSLPSESHESIS